MADSTKPTCPYCIFGDGRREQLCDCDTCTKDRELQMHDPKDCPWRDKNG